jgi:hypothetical protein
MLTNARGAAVLAGTVTKATFSGLPIVGCCADYTAASVAQPMLDFADALGVPAIVTDVAHDGDGPTPALVAALKLYSKWFVPGLSGKSYLEPDGATASTLCGPILTLSSPDVVSSPSKSDLVARSLRNFRRNHKLGLGPSALYVPRGNDPDAAPLPPVYLDHFVAYDSAGGQAAYYGGADAPTPYGSLPYYQILKSCWQSGNWTLSGAQSIWPSLPTTPQISMKLGIDALRAAQLPERYFFAPLVPLLLLPEYVGGGSFNFTLSKAAPDWLVGLGNAIGAGYGGYTAFLYHVVPTPGEVFDLVVRGNLPVGAATTVTLYRSQGGRTAYLPQPLATSIAAAVSSTSGRDSSNVVQVARGDLLAVAITTSTTWSTGGISATLQFRPTLRTIIGQEINA